MDEQEAAAVEAYEWTGHTAEEWALLSPEQRLSALMDVSAAEDDPPPAHVAERARDAYKRPYG
ncbi:hypothetical protein ACIBEJ_35240 [Nonomuraea sp. NPDC050790]|uniref:hypothetical protein n=1 Tax=Nonomuraea sp. NPDC050790 TaxID=3364371 RepID=UPI0037BA450B